MNTKPNEEEKDKRKQGLSLGLGKSGDNRLKEEELTEIRKIYSAIKTKVLMLEPEAEGRLDTELETRLAAVTAELKNSAGTEAEMSDAVRKALQLKAKYALLDLCYGKMVELQPSPEDVDLWTLLKSEHDQLVERLLNLVIGSRPELAQELSKCRRELAEMRKELADVLEVSQQQQATIQVLTQSKAALAKQSAADNAELQVQVNALMASNRKYIETIVRQSKTALTTANAGDHAASVLEASSFPDTKVRTQH